MSNDKITVLTNGTIYTNNPEIPVVSTVTAKDGIIISAGDNSAIPEDAEITDLKGRFVFPGFIDTYTAPAIDLFNQKAPSEEDFDDNDMRQWVGDCLDVVTDKGVTTLCLLPADDGFGGAFARIAAEIAEQNDQRPVRLTVLTDTSWLSEDDMLPDYAFENTFFSPKSSDLIFRPVFDDSESVREAIANLTVKAAAKAGCGLTGTIKTGAAADFVVFDENPLLDNLKFFSWAHAAMTFINGEKAYDADDAAMSEMYDMLISQTL